MHRFAMCFSVVSPQRTASNAPHLADSKFVPAESRRLFRSSNHKSFISIHFQPVPTPIRVTIHSLFVIRTSKTPHPAHSK
jgi:hypothetical protein